MLMTRSTSPEKSAWARCIDDINAGALPHQAGVLGQDGHTPLSLQIIRVHSQVLHHLVGAEGIGLAQQVVYQGGLAVVNVGNNGHIAQVISNVCGGDQCLHKSYQC